MCRYVRVLACALACAACAEPAIAQRLPDTVVPTHYTLTFTPDLATATFTGEAEIIVRVTRPTSTIVLNALELTIHESTVVQGATAAPAAVTYDKAAQQVTLQLQRPLAEGEARVRTRFAGALNDKLAGFYLSQTSKRRYAVTQFEATDARRAFPCFDEPSFKATFDIAIVADRGDLAISNGRVLRDVPGPGEGKHTVTFATTKRMSTYLVALLVGDFECLEGEAAGIPLRVCATPGHKASLPYAMERDGGHPDVLRRLLRDQVSRSRSSIRSPCPTSWPARWRTPVRSSIARRSSWWTRPPPRRNSAGASRT